MQTYLKRPKYLGFKLIIRQTLVCCNTDFMLLHKPVPRYRAITSEGSPQCRY